MVRIDKRSFIPEFKRVIRLLAALMFLAWTACYARCAAELAGGGATPVDACCQHEPPPASGSSGEEMPCGICDAIVSGGLIIAQPLLLAALVLVGLAAALAFPSRVLLWLKLMTMARSSLPRRVADPPWRGPRLWEYLARTACPVRGPSWIQA